MPLSLVLILEAISAKRAFVLLLSLVGPVVDVSGFDSAVFHEWTHT